VRGGSLLTALAVGMLLPSLALLVTRAPAVPRVCPVHIFMSQNPCPLLPPAVSSAERETVTLGMG